MTANEPPQRPPQPPNPFAQSTPADQHSGCPPAIWDGIQYFCQACGVPVQRARPAYEGPGKPRMQPAMVRAIGRRRTNVKLPEPPPEEIAPVRVDAAAALTTTDEPQTVEYLAAKSRMLAEKNAVLVDQLRATVAELREERIALGEARRELVELRARAASKVLGAEGGPTVVLDGPELELEAQAHGEVIPMPTGAATTDDEPQK